MKKVMSSLNQTRDAIVYSSNIRWQKRPKIENIWGRRTRGAKRKAMEIMNHPDEFAVMCGKSKKVRKELALLQQGKVVEFECKNTPIPHNMQFNIAC